MILAKADVSKGRLINLAQIALLAEATDSRQEVRLDLLRRLHSFKDMTTFSLLLHNIIYSDISLNERLELCQYVIGLRNKRTTQDVFNFNYDPQTQSLDISNNPWIKIALCLRNFPAKKINASNTSINHGNNFMSPHLEYLDISNTQIVELKSLKCKNLKSLNISGNIIHNLDPLEQYPLISLDISYTPIKYLNFVPKIPTLKQITIKKKQFSRAQLKWLRPDIELIEK